MYLLILFLLTVLSSLLGNLKQILLIKDNGYKKYLITLLDTLMFVYVIKSVVSTNTLETITSFVLGKMVSLLLTDIIMEKLGFKVYLVNLYVHENEEDKIKEYLYNENISFTAFKGDFMGQLRTNLSIHLNKKQLSNLQEKLSDMQINPTMDISEVKVLGKIKERV